MIKPYKIYIISLPSKLDRREFITKQLEFLKLDYTIIDAIDGKNLQQDEYESLVDTVAIAPNLKWITKGAIGCALSHYEAYKRISEENFPYALILEDDCVLDNRLPQILNSVDDFMKGSDIALLYFSSWKPIYLKPVPNIELANGYRLYDTVDSFNLASAVAYIISKKAAKSLFNAAFPIKTSVDHWGHFLSKGTIQKIRCIYPMPVGTADFKSTLGYLSETTCLGRLSALIDKYKIFPVFQILKLRRRRILKNRRRIKIIN